MKIELEMNENEEQQVCLAHHSPTSEILPFLKYFFVIVCVSSQKNILKY